MFELKLINPPAWAAKYTQDYSQLSTAEVEGLVGLEKEMIALLHSTLSEYAEDFYDENPNEVEDPYEYYPNKYETTGEYYISDKRSYKQNNNIYTSFNVELLENSIGMKDSTIGQRNYYGMEVLLVLTSSGELESDGVVSSWGS